MDKSRDDEFGSKYLIGLSERDIPYRTYEEGQEFTASFEDLLTGVTKRSIFYPLCALHVHTLQRYAESPFVEQSTSLTYLSSTPNIPFIIFFNSKDLPFPQLYSSHSIRIDCNCLK
jgi:hypothetical protein